MNAIYHPRTVHLPDRNQSYLHLPGIRPHRGPCPDCAAEEHEYCDASCDLQDPFAYNNITTLRRCGRCDVLYSTDKVIDVYVLPSRSVKHIALQSRSACGLARPPKATRYRQIRW